MYLHLHYYKMSTKRVVHVHAQYKEHALKFKAKDRLHWPKLIKTHKHPPKGEQILSLNKQRGIQPAFLTPRQIFVPSVTCFDIWVSTLWKAVF